MVYKWYILPIGGLYATYHLLGEPETTIDNIPFPINTKIFRSWLVRTVVNRGGPLGCYQYSQPHIHIISRGYLLGPISLLTCPRKTPSPKNPPGSRHSRFLGEFLFWCFCCFPSDAPRHPSEQTPVTAYGDGILVVGKQPRASKRIKKMKDAT